MNERVDAYLKACKVAEELDRDSQRAYETQKNLYNKLEEKDFEFMSEKLRGIIKKDSEAKKR